MIEIIQGDCLKVMRGMPDNSIDCVITSPPYNMRLRVRNGQYTEREWGEHFSKKYSDFHDAMPINDYYEFHSSCIKEMLRISPIVFWNIQIVTGSKDALFKIIGKFYSEIRDIIIWDKKTAQPAMNSMVLNSGYELIIIFDNTGRKGRQLHNSYFDRGTLDNVWRLGRGGRGDIKGHSAVFPIELVTKILTNFTKENDTILDPFLGTGTTARACKDLSRNCIGIEISPEYIKIAQDRLKQEVLL